MKFKLELIGSKLTYLREISVNDYCVIIEWLNDKKFNKLLYQGWETVTLEKFSKQIEDEKLNEEAQIFVQCKYSDNKVVGWCGLFFPKNYQHKQAKKAEIRSFVGTEFWGNGFGTEQYIILARLGFEIFDLNRIHFGTHQKNIGTQKIYEKLGFKMEGILRDDFYHYEFADIYLYSILKIEYNQKFKKSFKDYDNMIFS